MAGRGSKPGERRGGRKPGVPNKATAEIKSVAQAYGVDAIEELARISKRSDSDAARVAAIRELLDRGYGRPAQSLEHSGNGPVAAVQIVINSEDAKVL